MTAPAPALAFDARSSAARLLVFGGIGLILTGMLLGEIFAIFVSHVDSAHVLREWVTIVIPAMEQHDSVAMDAGYSRIEDLLERRGRIMDTHSHVIAYGFVALALALLQPVSKYSESTRRALALCIVLGGLLQAGSVFTSYWLPVEFRDWAWAGSGAGGALVLLGVIGNCLGLGSTSLRFDLAAESSHRLRSPSSRILLRTGVFLILAGMVFGFYYAWVFVNEHEPSQVKLLDSAVHSALSQDTTAATSSVTAYRRLQSRIAIVTAAHSHVIEMGIMAMLLAFVQDFVLLSDRWKRRWAILFCLGAAVMPICTYCASIFGLVPAGFADTFGLISMIALFAMLWGLIRHTGALESRYAP